MDPVSSAKLTFCNTGRAPPGQDKTQAVGGQPSGFNPNGRGRPGRDAGVGDFAQTPKYIACLKPLFPARCGLFKRQQQATGQNRCGDDRSRADLIADHQQGARRNDADLKNDPEAARQGRQHTRQSGPPFRQVDRPGLRAPPTPRQGGQHAQTSDQFGVADGFGGFGIHAHRRSAAVARWGSEREFGGQGRRQQHGRGNRSDQSIDRVQDEQNQGEHG